MQAALLDAMKVFDQKPIIIIHDTTDVEYLQTYVQTNKLKHLAGVENDHLQQIKSWDYGILFLKADECRGVDTRFAKDALVIIISEVKSYHELLQMIGRSNRSRGSCEATLYIDTHET